MVISPRATFFDLTNYFFYSASFGKIRAKQTDGQTGIRDE
jgi:hypothetical protein